jgi:hypothetical protein
LLVIVNFDNNPQSKHISLQIPSNALAILGLASGESYKLKEIFMNGKTLSFTTNDKINLKLSPLGSYVYSIEK